MTVAILAAEQSGDQLGAGLLTQLQRPAFGMGGALLAQAGLEVIAPPTHVMGVTDVVCALPQLISRFYQLKQTICRRAPPAVITVDAPDFFLPLHRSLRRAGYRGALIHMVSPSIWAWRAGRIRTMARTLDALLVLLPFEPPYYANSGLEVSYIGHPLAHEISHLPHAPWPCKHPILALFPGSRRAEIAANLPVQLAAAKHFPNHQLIVCLARESLRPLIPQHLHTLLSHDRHRLMQAADCALATSGTICLELGLHGVPTVMTYHLSSLHYWLGRSFFRIDLPFYTLPNLITKREMIPEHIDVHLNPNDIALSLNTLRDNREALHILSTQLRLLCQGESSCEGSLTCGTSPYEMAATLIHKHLTNTK